MRGAVRLLGLVPILIAVREPTRADELERYARAEMELNQIPGLAVAILERDRVLLRAWGVRDLLTGEPMTVDTPVELASVSKPLTAAAVARLIRAGRLDGDRPASEWLAELRGSRLERVTVRSLLRQRSGLRRRHDRTIPCCGRPGDRDLSLAAGRLARARPAGGASPPFAYANSNYVLLAALVERASGMRFQRFMEQEIFLPLGMSRTTADPAQARRWSLAGAHERSWGRVRARAAPEAGWLGASLVKSTARDMALFLEAALAGRVVGIERPETLVPPYDAGWFVRRQGNLLVLEHSGDTWGANAALLLAPERHLGVAVLVNAGVQRALEIARAIAAWRLGGRLPPPRRPAWYLVADNWAMLFGALSLATLAGLVTFWLRTHAQFRRGVRVWLLPHGVWERGRLLLLGAMTAYLLALAARGLMAGASSSPSSLRLCLAGLAVAAAAGLGTAAALGATARKSQN
ncbi:MAG: serine hydrolase domain-containing protein [Bryobacterales bacterium]|nr:beta-lactamase family protein [Bryobacteraceae bacterium]MDW8129235.1 serine hydrolase domain-containing protein [Bryobacterales bacterium]